jgi:hypothetical protein
MEHHPAEDEQSQAVPNAIEMPYPQRTRANPDLLDDHRLDRGPSEPGSDCLGQIRILGQ